MRRTTSTLLLLLTLALLLPGATLAASDPAAVEVAHAVMERMGGEQAWNDTRFVSWNFFGNRRHWWDRHSGDVRIEYQGRDGSSNVILMNINSKDGRAFKNDEPLSGDDLAQALEGGYGAWVNDAYWMFMPYKLLDPGVTLTDEGEKEMEGGGMARVLAMTFDSVGLTPQNKYLVWVGKESGLVEAWTFYVSADDPEPRFTSPWKGWKKFGNIMLATDHGRGLDWDVAVHDALPRSVFESAVPIAAKGE